MKNQHTIGELCTEITSGATNSLYEPNDAETSSHKLLLGSSLDIHGGVNPQGLKDITVKKEKNIDRFKAEMGDVAILAKGNSIRTAYISQDIARQNVIVSANFILLRPDPALLLGEALVAYYNSPAGRFALEGLSMGAVVKNISVTNIKKHCLPLPSMDVQQQVAELFHAGNEVYKNLTALAEQERLTVNACISQLFQGE